jgi:hypothetical protein
MDLKMQTSSYRPAANANGSQLRLYIELTSVKTAELAARKKWWI